MVHPAVFMYPSVNVESSSPTGRGKLSVMTDADVGADDPHSWLMRETRSNMSPFWTGFERREKPYLSLYAER